MDISSDTLIGTVFHLPKPNGRYQPNYRTLLQELGRLRQVVLLAFPPKAAGTFLRSIIVDAIDGQLVRVSHALGGRDATPYLPTFLQYYMGGVTGNVFVGHAHMLALESNLHFLEVFGIRPIVIKRSIPDMLVSYRDMLDTDDVAMAEGLNCHIPENYRTLTDEEKNSFLIDVLGPWYVNYYAGWISFADAHPDRLAVIDFRDVKTDPVGVACASLTKIGIAVDKDRVKMAAESAWRDRAHLRFNKGESGRGARSFTPAQIGRLARLMGYYPCLAPYRDELLYEDLEAAA